MRYITKPDFLNYLPIFDLFVYTKITFKLLRKIVAFVYIFDSEGISHKIKFHRNGRRGVVC